jgi:hypothetical protein
MLKFFKALIIGYAVLWGVDEIKARRPIRDRDEGPRKRLRPRRPQQ